MPQRALERHPPRRLLAPPLESLADGPPRARAAQRGKVRCRRAALGGEREAIRALETPQRDGRALQLRVKRGAQGRVRTREWQGIDNKGRFAVWSAGPVFVGWSAGPVFVVWFVVWSAGLVRSCVGVAGGRAHRAVSHEALSFVERRRGEEELRQQRAPAADPLELGARAAEARLAQRGQRVAELLGGGGDRVGAPPEAPPQPHRRRLALAVADGARHAPKRGVRAEARDGAGGGGGAAAARHRRRGGAKLLEDETGGAPAVVCAHGMGMEWRRRDNRRERRRRRVVMW